MVFYNSPSYEQWVPGIEIDHVGAARAHLASTLPEASLSPASVEMTVLEAMAVMLGPVAMAYQAAPAAVMEHVMAYYGLTRTPGQPAKGRARFRASASAPRVEIPQGTVLRYFLNDQAGVLEFKTTEPLTILTADSVVGEAHIEATEIGTSHNGVPVGARLDTTDYFMDIEYVNVSVRTRFGEDRESNASFEERALAMLARQSTALNHADQFGSAALTRPEVGRVQVVDNWNPNLGTPVNGVRPGGRAVGHVTVAVTGIDGSPLLEPDREALQVWLQEMALASLAIHVVAPNYSFVDIEVTVEATAAANLAAVQAAVTDELARRLNPLTWDWWPTISALDIASWVDDVPGVARVVAVPSNGFTLPGIAPLPQRRSLVVNVDKFSR